MRVARTTLVTGLFLGAISSAAAAQDAGPRSLAAARLGGAAPVMDGRLDDAPWADAPVATGFVQRRPDAGAAASRPTEVRVLFTDGALYVGARMTDSPDSIAAQLSRRDDGDTYSDWLFVMLDSDDDNRSAYVLGVNPREVQQDFILAEDGGQDANWDAVWAVRTATDAQGWTAEFRIPLSQLRFSPRAGTWGLNFQRVIARREETSYWAPIPPDAPGFVSRFGALTGLAGLSSPTRLELRPYAVSRVTRAPGDGDNPFYSHNEPSASTGLDLRYSLTSAFTLTATVNPDFGQVEADPSEVNLTAFETRLAEQRPFFVEDSRLFQFKLGGSAGDLMYTRRIGGTPHGAVPGDAEFSDQPERTTILGAAKVSGRANGWSLGALTALTGEERAPYTIPGGGRESVAVEPLTSFNVVRVMRDFNGGGSALGGIATLVNRGLGGTGLDFMRSSAVTAGVDGRHRFGGGNFELSGYLVGSGVRGSEAAILSTQTGSAHRFQRPDAPHLEVDSSLTSLTGWVANLEVGKIGGGHWTWELGGRARSPGLEINDLGFQQQTDRAEQYAGAGYLQFRPGPVFRTWALHAFQRAEWTYGREFTQGYYNLEGSFQLNNFWSGSAVVERYQQALSPSELRGGPALVTDGQTLLTLRLAGDQRKRISWSVASAGGMLDEGDGYSLAVVPSLQLRPSPRLNVSLGPSVRLNRVPAQYLSQFTDDGGVRRFAFARLRQTTTALTARLSYTFTPRLSLQYYGQPFISSGTYSDVVQVADPGAGRFGDRFTPLAMDEVPDFNVRQFRSNAVLRWEYRPGSTLFLVWNTDMQQDDPTGQFNLVRDTRRLFGSEGTNVLLIKLSYWLGI
ncbi:carbohydrate binding family 9 domain-containing protein [Longimicrobium terrae]|nr:carbohydrate binding family 9 domain-containing protein [Longimicrobium terrae]